MNYFINIGNNIMEQIKVLGLKQTTVADKIGVSRQVFQKIVKGQKAINVFELSNIANALGTTIDELVKETTFKQNIEPEFQFMGEFANGGDLEKLNMIIDQYLDMMEDIDELRKNTNR
jgi:transcriptional regulator with XRE-family HTH domain